MFVVTVRFAVKPEHAAAFLARVKQQAADSLALEADCRQFDVCRQAEPGDAVFLYEIYSDEAAFRDHLASDHFKAFDAEVRDWIAEKTVETWQRAAPGGA